MGCWFLHTLFITQTPTMLGKTAFFTLLAGALADWAGNINYGSPSYLHNLGISIPKIRKRQAGASYMDPRRVNFTHDVASGDPYADSVILWVSSTVKATTSRPNYLLDTCQPYDGQ